MAAHSYFLPRCIECRAV